MEDIALRVGEKDNAIALALHGFGEEVDAAGGEADEGGVEVLDGEGEVADAGCLHGVGGAFAFGVDEFEHGAVFCADEDGVRRLVVDFEAEHVDVPIGESNDVIRGDGGMFNSSDHGTTIVRLLLAAEAEGESGGECDGVAGGGVDGHAGGGGGEGLGLDEVLGLEVAAVGEVIDGEEEVGVAVEAAEEAEVEDGVACGAEGGVLLVEAVAVDGPQAGRAAPAFPTGDGEGGVGGEVGGAVDIGAGRGIAVEGVNDLGDSAAEGDAAGELDGRFGLEAIGAAGAEEFEGAVVGDVDHFVGAVDPEQVGGEGEAVEVGGYAGFIEIGGGEFGAIAAGEDAAGIDGGDTAAVVGVKGEGCAAGGRPGEAELRLETGSGFGGGESGVEAVADIEAEGVEAEAGGGEEFAGEEAHVFLDVSGAVGDVGIGGGGDADGVAANAGVEADVDLVGVEVPAGGEIGVAGAGFVGAEILDVGTLDEAGIVLLDGVAVDGVVEEEGEVGVEIEKGPGEEAVDFPDSAIREFLAEVGGGCGGADFAAFAGIEEAEAGKGAVVDEIERDLAGGVVAVGAAIESQAHGAETGEAAGDIGGEVVAAVIERFQERPVAVGAFIGEEGVDVFPVRAKGEKTALGVEGAALEADGELVGEGFAEANVDDAEAREVAVLGAEGAIDETGFLDEFWGEGFEAAEVALAVALGGLVLLDVVDEDFHAAADAAVIQIEAKAADLDGLAAALVLAGVDAGIELMEDLIVAGEEGLVEYLLIALIDGRFHRGGGDGDGSMDFGKCLAEGGGERECGQGECGEKAHSPTHTRAVVFWMG